MRLMRPCWSRSQRRSWRPFGWFRAPPTHVTDDDGDESLDTAAAMASVVKQQYLLLGSEQGGQNVRGQPRA